jgi:hypothetical protein
MSTLEHGTRKKRAPCALSAPGTSLAPAVRAVQLSASMCKAPCAADSAMAIIMKPTITAAYMATRGAPQAPPTSEAQGACHASARQSWPSGGARRWLEGRVVVWATYGAARER